MQIRDFAVVAAVAALTGCANMEYPKDWSPQLKQDSGCLSLSGTYRNAPSSVVPEGAPVLELRQFLQPRQVSLNEWEAARRSDVQTVTIEQEKEVVTITEHSEAGTRTSQLHLRDVFSYLMVKPADGVGCARAQWLRKGPEAGGAIPGAIVSEGSAWGLFKAEDGAIVVNLLSGRIGVIMIVPFGDQRFLWYRYDPVR
jgi:hypothetical protein